MKVLYAIGVLCISAVTVFGGLDKVVLSCDNVSTDATISVDSDGPVKGYAERLLVWYVAPSSNYLFNVNIIASNPVSHTTQSIYASGPISNSFIDFNPRTVIKNPGNADMTGTNAPTRFVLFDDRIYMQVTNAVFTNLNVKAMLIYERP